MSSIGFAGENFRKVVYFEHGGTGDGNDVNNPLPIADDTSFFTVPAKSLVTNCYVLLDTAVTGTTDFDVGDATNADGLIDGSASLTLATPGVYSFDGTTSGAYLLAGTDGNQAKWYSSATALAIDVTGTSTAGKFRIVLEGVHFGR